MHTSQLNWIIRIIALVGLLLLVAPFFVYIVDEREMAVVLRLGKPVRQVVEPTISWKLPFLETVRILPKTKQLWGGDNSHVLPDLPTRDDKKIELVPWAVWKINNPTIFVSRMRTMHEAEERVYQVVRGAMRDVITQHDLADLVRSTNRPMRTAQVDLEDDTLNINDLDANSRKVAEGPILLGRTKLLDAIRKEAQDRLASGAGVGPSEDSLGRGIELIDIGIAQIDFVRSVRDKTFDRWITEREAISARNYHEGARIKQEILNQTHAEAEKITGEGKQKSNTIRGRVDAEVIKRYADAIEQTGEFYTFVRTLEAYEKAIGKDTQLVLTTDNEFLQLLQKLGAPQTPAPR